MKIYVNNIMHTIQENKSLILISQSENETQRYGELLGSLLSKGSVIALLGTLGVGKTYLSKGISKGLGVKNTRIVTSPTFAILNIYNGRLPIYHFDTYRLNNADELYDLGSDEIFWGNGVSIVEWADKVIECLPNNYIKIVIEYYLATQRKITISSSDYDNNMIIEQFKTRLN